MQNRRPSNLRRRTKEDVRRDRKRDDLLRMKRDLLREEHRIREQQIRDAAARLPQDAA